MHYKHGSIQLESGKVNLKVPNGYKFLGKEQSYYVLTDLWGNPEEAVSDVLGMIMPERSDPFSDSSYAFIVSFEKIGFVKDDDAAEIDYDEMMKNLKQESESANVERMKNGYEPRYIIGWAQKPFYDKDRKILHWAKEIKFGENPEKNTLNYDVRILGKEGILSMNAVSTIDQLNLVKNDIPKILDIATFSAGNAYSDFNPDIDQVAAWTIGGLVAGKVLAKVGFLAVILKFLAPLWKFLALAFLPFIGWFKKKFSRTKEPEYALAVPNAEPEVSNSLDDSEKADAGQEKS